MARQVDLDVHLSEWAAWHRAATRDKHSAIVPTSLAALDAVIGQLPVHLAIAIAEVYQVKASMGEHALRLACPEATLARRLGQAHRLLIDLLRLRLSDEARLAEQRDMRERLGRPSHAQAPG